MWAKFDDKRALNAKLREAGLEARGLDEAAICWCAHEENDGHLRESDVAMLAAAHGCRRWKAVAERLVTVGRWKPTEDGYEIVAFLEFNPSRDELVTRRADKQRAGRIGGVRSGITRRAQASAQANSEAPASVLVEPPSRPVPSRPEKSSSESDLRPAVSELGRRPMPLGGQHAVASEVGL